MCLRLCNRVNETLSFLQFRFQLFMSGTFENNEPFYSSVALINIFAYQLLSSFLPEIPCCYVDKGLSSY